MEVICRPAISFLSIDDAMKQAKTFTSLKQCLDYIVKSYNIEDVKSLNISYYGEDDRINWKEVYLICNRYGSALCFMTIKN